SLYGEVKRAVGVFVCHRTINENRAVVALEPWQRCRIEGKCGGRFSRAVALPDGSERGCQVFCELLSITYGRVQQHLPQMGADRRKTLQIRGELFRSFDISIPVGNH